MGQRVEVMVESKAVSLLDNSIREAVRCKKTPAYRAIEKVVRRFIARGAVNDSTNMKIDSHTEWKVFVQALTSSHIENLTVTTPNTQFVKHHAQVTVDKEVNFLRHYTIALDCDVLIFLALAI